MGVTLTLLRVAVVLGTAALVVRATAGWRAAADRLHAAVALSVALLAGATVAGRAAQVTDTAEGALGSLALGLFAASGVAVLGVRHAVLPLPVRVWRASVAASAAAVALAVAARTGRDPQSAPSVVAAGLVAATWAAVVAEPVVRLWRTGEHRPAVQRGRIRALSAAYAGIAVLGLASVAVAAADADGPAVVLEAVVLVALPGLYVGLIAPQWVRRWWREPEERAVAAALRQLAAAGDAAEVTGQAVEWAVRLVGGHAAVVVGPAGRVAASAGPEVPSLVELARQVASSGAGSGPVPLAREEPRWAIAVPLQGPGGALGVLSDPVAPLFGRDELDALSAYAASVADALDRALLADAVRRESERYETLLRALGDLGAGFVVVDRSTDRIVYANRTLEEMTGYTNGELLALPSFRPLLTDEEAEAVAEAIDAAARGEVISDAYESTGVRADGMHYAVEVAGKVTEDGRHAVALVRDVSERRRVAELEARRFEQLSRLAVLAGDLAGRSRHVDELLPAAAEAARGLLGSEWVRVTVRDVSGARDHRADAGATSGGVAVEVPLVRGPESNGTLTIGPRQGGIPFDDVDAAVLANFAAYLAEAIALAQSFERESALVGELREMHRMKDTLMSAVSHELRGPLTVLMGVASTLERQRSALSDDDAASMMRTVARNARKIDRLVGDLLDIDRIQRGVLEPDRSRTDLRTLIGRVVDEAMGPSRAHLRIDVPHVEADVDGPKVERIVENLLLNAERHTPPGTAVWISLRPEPEGFLLAVDDEGPGVPDGEKSVVFEPFRRGEDSAAPGLGIGLSLVQRFARLHGGEAWVEDRPAGGASFRVRIPCPIVVSGEPDGSPSSARSASS